MTVVSPKPWGESRLRQGAGIRVQPEAALPNFQMNADGSQGGEKTNGSTQSTLTAPETS